MSYICGFHIIPYFILLSPIVRTHFTTCCARMSVFWPPQQTLSTPWKFRRKEILRRMGACKDVIGLPGLSGATFYLDDIPFLGSHGNLQRQACPTNEDRRVSALPGTVTAAQAQETPSEAPQMLSQLFGGVAFQGPWAWKGWRSDKTHFAFCSSLYV